MNVVRLRDLQLADAAFLFRLRNDPATRWSSPMHDQGITWTENVRSIQVWVRAFDRQAYVATLNRKAVGVVRWRLAGLWYELSWIVAPECRQRGIGSTMVNSVMRTLPRKCFARILEGNVASERIAAKCGLAPVENVDGVRIWRSRRPYYQPVAALQTPVPQPPVQARSEMVLPL